MVRIRAALATVMLTACAALPATLPAQAVPEAERQAIEQAIRALHVEMRAAAGKLDAAALYAHVLDTETPPIVEDGQIAATRALALASTAAGFQGLTSVSYHYTLEHITVLSPTLALWVGAGSASVRLTDGRELSAPFAETIVLQQRAGKWQVLHAHRSAPNPS